MLVNRTSVSITVVTLYTALHAILITLSNIFFMHINKVNGKYIDIFPLVCMFHKIVAILYNIFIFISDVWEVFFFKENY